MRVIERTAELQGKNRELLKQTEVVRDLSGRLLQSQDEERRRIACELHDSAGQLLAAINMNVSKVAREKEKLSTDAGRSVEEAADVVQHALVEIRTMSHLLHPPLLDEVGLESAIRGFIEGFAQRSKIDVNLIVAPDFERLSPDLEITIFASSRNVLQMFTVILGVGRLRFAWLGGMAVYISKLATRVKASLWTSSISIPLPHLALDFGGCASESDSWAEHFRSAQTATVRVSRPRCQLSRREPNKTTCSICDSGEVATLS